MAHFIENLKKSIKSSNDRRFLEKFEKDPQHFFRVGYAERVRWFELVGRKERIWAMEKGYVRDSGTLDRLFPKYANLVAPYMHLSDEQFGFILQDGYSEALEGYIGKCGTLSVSKVRAFINATVRRAGQNAPTPMSEASKRMPDLLYSYIRREGLPAVLGSFVHLYPVEEIGEIKENIERCSYIHSQICAVKSGMVNCQVSYKFETFLSYLKKEGKILCDEAAVLMTGSQVLAYHKAGLHLSKKAIVMLLTFDENETTTDSILTNEVLYPMWPELKYVLEARPDTYYKYQCMLLSGDLKKEANS